VHGLLQQLFWLSRLHAESQQCARARCRSKPQNPAVACRAEQNAGRRLFNQQSLEPRNFMSGVQDWKQYYNNHWTPDRGSDAHELERQRLRRPALVQTGRSGHLDNPLTPWPSSLECLSSGRC